MNIKNQIFNKMIDAIIVFSVIVVPKVIYCCSVCFIKECRDDAIDRCHYFDQQAIL